MANHRSQVAIDELLRAFFDAIPKPTPDGIAPNIDAAKEGIEVCKGVVNTLRAEAYARSNVRLLLDVQTLITELNMVIQAVAMIEAQNRQGLVLPGPFTNAG